MTSVKCDFENGVKSGNEQLRKYQDPKDPGALIRAPITGGMRALQVLADDLYQLAHALDPPGVIHALSSLRSARCHEEVVQTLGPKRGGDEVAVALKVRRPVSVARSPSLFAL